MCVCVCVCVCFPPGCVALWDSKTPHRPTSERFSCCLETTAPPSRLLPQDGSPSLTLLSVFLCFIFCLPHFEENGLPFWVPGVLRQCSEVVLGKLLSTQMIFCWIFWGENVLPILFLSHLSVSPIFSLFLKIYVSYIKLEHFILENGRKYDSRHQISFYLSNGMQYISESFR